MENVVITGGAGFIGFQLAHKLAHDGHRVILLDNLSRGVMDGELSRLCDLPNVDFREINLLSGRLDRAIPRDTAIIFHLAAIVGVSHVLRNGFDVLRKNVEMLFRIVDAARELGSFKKLLFASTSEVYAGALASYGIPIPTPESTPLATGDLTAPRTSYMLSKIFGECACYLSGLPITIFRPHNVYGPRMGMSHVIPELLRKVHDARDGDDVELFSPDHTRTFCFVHDAVEALSLAMKSESVNGTTWNLGASCPEIQIRELAFMIAEIVGRRVHFKELPPTAGSPARRCPDTSRAEDLLGFSARVALVEGIRLTYDWYRDNIFNNAQPGAV